MIQYHQKRRIGENACAAVRKAPQAQAKGHLRTAVQAVDHIGHSPAAVSITTPISLSQYIRGTKQRLWRQAEVSVFRVRHTYVNMGRAKSTCACCTSLSRRIRTRCVRALVVLEVVGDEGVQHSTKQTYKTSVVRKGCNSSSNNMQPWAHTSHAHISAPHFQFLYWSTVIVT